MADRLFYIALRDLYQRFPCTCDRLLVEGNCVGCALRAEFGIDVADPLPAPPARHVPPWSTFKWPTCRGAFPLGTACGHCEKCIWYLEQANR